MSYGDQQVTRGDKIKRILDLAHQSYDCHMLLRVIWVGSSTTGGTAGRELENKERLLPNIVEGLKT